MRAEVRAEVRAEERELEAERAAERAARFRKRFSEWQMRMHAFVNRSEQVRRFTIRWRGRELRAVSFRGGPLELYRVEDGLEQFVGYANEVLSRGVGAAFLALDQKR